MSKTRVLKTAAGSNIGEIQKLFLPYFLNHFFWLKAWTFLRAVGRFTLGISLSFPLLIRGAVESRELCGEEYGCWWPFNMDGTLVEPEPWNGVVVPTAEKDNKVSLQARCEYVYMYARFRLLSVTVSHTSATQADRIKEIFQCTFNPWSNTPWHWVRPLIKRVCRPLV